MVIEMNDEQLRSLADLQGFLDGTVTMDFTVAEDERYAFIARTVKRFGYGRLNRSDKAVVLRFLERVSGYSRQQISRLVKRGSERRALIKRYRGSRTSYARTYTSADVLLLAHTDTLHGTLSGLATKETHGALLRARVLTEKDFTANPEGLRKSRTFARSLVALALALALALATNISP